MPADWQHLEAQFNACERLKWAPIRHFSPACCVNLRSLLQSFSPDVVLIEAPADFEHLIPAIASKDTHLPVAIYQQGCFFPFAENSPEYQAIKWAVKANANIQFIDRPKLANADVQAVWDDSWLQNTAFNEQLQTQYQCRDYDELWCRLFEQRSFEGADDFFLKVLLFCASSRALFSEKQLAKQGDLARESFMRSAIKQAMQHNNKVLVLTGGFHTPALFDFKNAGPLLPKKAPESFLVRYSEPQLDALLGYRSGMPFPALMRMWLQLKLKNKGTTSSDSFYSLLTFGCPNFISVADKMAATHHLALLLQLRSLDEPSCYDLQDSISSCWVKGDDKTCISQIQKAWQGTVIGEIPAGMACLPLIENVRIAAKKHRLSLTLSEQKNSKIDVFQLNEQTLARREFFFTCYYLELSFCHRMQGADFTRGVDLDRQHEHWQYQWTPHVEVSLIEMTELGDTLTMVLSSVLLKHWQECIQADSFLLMVEWVANAIQCGKLILVEQNFAQLLLVIEKQTKLGELVQAITHINSLAYHPLFTQSQDTLLSLSERLWQQIGEHLTQLNNVNVEEGIQLLQSLQGLALRNHSDLKSGWLDRLQVLLKQSSHKTWLYFAIASLIADINGHSSNVLEELKLQLFREPNQAFDSIQAIFRLLPHWINHYPILLSFLNDWLKGLSEAQFQLFLPPLRKMFNDRDSREIDTIASKVQQLNHWQQRLDWQPRGIEQASVAEAIELEAKVSDLFQQQGLSSWLTT